MSDKKENITTECVKGNAPECPSCGNWNALLDGFDHTPHADGTRREHYFECRDCGFKVDAKDLTIRIKTLDKEGMGSASTYTITHEIKGNEF